MQGADEIFDVGQLCRRLCHCSSGESIALDNRTLQPPNDSWPVVLHDHGPILPFCARNERSDRGRCDLRPSDGVVTCMYGVRAMVRDAILNVGDNVCILLDETCSDVIFQDVCFQGAAPPRSADFVPNPGSRTLILQIPSCERIAPFPEQQSHAQVWGTHPCTGTLPSRTFDRVPRVRAEACCPGLCACCDAVLFRHTRPSSHTTAVVLPQISRFAPEAEAEAEGSVVDPTSLASSMHAPIGGHPEAPRRPAAAPGSRAAAMSSVRAHITAPSSHRPRVLRVQAEPSSAAAAAAG